MEEGGARGQVFRRPAGRVGVLLAVFAGCWLPLNVMNAVTLLAGRTTLDAVKSAVILSHANSAVNPVLYAYSNSAFAAAFRRILRLPQRDASASSTAAAAPTFSANA